MNIKTNSTEIIIYEPEFSYYVIIPAPRPVMFRRQKIPRRSVPRQSGTKVMEHGYPLRVRLAPFKRHVSTHEN